VNAVRWFLLPGIAAALAAGAAPARGGAGPARGGLPAASLQQGAPAEDDELPVLQVHRYRMSGRIRPLLFWIGRDDVGLGEIVWRRAENGVGYELLIGTDAAKAPRGINRWGYLLEDSRPSRTRVLGVMTTSDEATLSDVARKTEAGQRHGRFKAIQAHIASGVSRSATETLETEREFSVREKGALVPRVQERLRDAAPKEIPVPPGVRPGFLVAVAEMVGAAVDARGEGKDALRRLKGSRSGYVYGRNLYELTLAGIEPMGPAASAKDRGYPVHADFETRNLTAGTRSTFELEFRTAGALAGVPTLIRHQPRWWLQAVLTLDDR
jgi:hypothetical protein